MRLEGKRAIVTGAGSGFGEGIAMRFAAEGPQVMVADINVEGAERVASACGGIAQRVDVANGDSVAEMVARAVAEMGRVDILVNNAGITHLPAPMEEVSEDDFDRVFAVNCKSKRPDEM